MLKKDSKVLQWFSKRGYTPADFQLKSWQSYRDEKDFLVHVSTGLGKTLGGVAAAMEDLSESPVAGVGILYISPLRALTNDLGKNLESFNQDAGLGLKIGLRTGDTTGSERAQQKEAPPDVMLTTPESFNLMLVNKDFQKSFKDIRLIVIDEWHALYPSKRGVLLQLNVSWLLELATEARLAILSATLGNPEQAANGLAPYRSFEIITSDNEKVVKTEILMPKKVDRFPWAGHLGSSQFENLAQNLDKNVSTLIFTNTRSQTERWKDALTYLLPEFAEKIGIHHSSIEREIREGVEKGLNSGKIKWAVCTSSLDLGIDLPTVKQVVQIGSPKSVARFVQRAGRSEHTPTGAPSILFVPTHALEMFEYMALKKALKERSYEPEDPPLLCFDVLAQFLLSYALVDGLDGETAFNIVSRTYSFKALKRTEFDQVLEHASNGGKCLQTYPNYLRLKEFKGKRYFIDKKKMAEHRLNMGTITSHPMIRVKYKNGAYLGKVEENFAGKLKKGDVFSFGGKILKRVLLKNNTLYVEKAKSKKSVVPVWAGGRLPMSGLLSHHLQELLFDIEKQKGEVFKKLAPIINAQNELSSFPRRGKFLFEVWDSREGRHVFFYPFEGRAVHEALASVFSYRANRDKSMTLSFSVNEYGLEVLGPLDWEFTKEEFMKLLSPEKLGLHLSKSFHQSDLEKRQFSEIAQIAGLVRQNSIGSRRDSKNLQMSTGLLYDVFKKYQPENPYLVQARDEVLARLLGQERLLESLKEIQKLEPMPQFLLTPSPLAFPLVIERIGATLSREDLKERVERMKKRMLKAG